MKALQSPTVVVIDDDHEEALPLLRVMSSIGVGACYFTGDKDQLPEKPLEGIRLVLLDLRLFETVPGEPRHYIASTLAVLNPDFPYRSSISSIMRWRL
ncbi:MAG TPA: hypothetical protein PLD58_16845, partial [Phycisphaerae bacterium]|nr:hypothetical protein [Phycisphaerae bacterium]